MTECSSAVRYTTITNAAAVPLPIALMGALFVPVSPLLPIPLMWFLYLPFAHLLLPMPLTGSKRAPIKARGTVAALVIVM